jgi:hypothetical protein
MGPIGAERVGHASQGDGLGVRLNGCGGWISIEKGKHRGRGGGSVDNSK